MCVASGLDGSCGYLIVLYLHWSGLITKN